MDDEAKLTLHGLVQHYSMLDEVEKNRKLNDLLDALDFNQVTLYMPLAPDACLLSAEFLALKFPALPERCMWRENSEHTSIELLKNSHCLSPGIL